MVDKKSKSVRKRYVLVKVNEEELSAFKEKAKQHNARGNVSKLVRDTILADEPQPAA